MGLSQTEIARLWLWSLLVGGALGAVYDCLRLTRLLPGGVPPVGLRGKRLPVLGVLPPVKQRKATAVLIFFEDLLFGVIAGVAVVLLFYEAFDGKLRLPALGLVALGFGVFRMTLGRAAKRVSAWIAFVLEVAVRYLCHAAALPVRGLALAAGRAHRAAQRRARRTYTNRKFGELKRWEEVQNGKNKEKAIQPEPDGQDFSRAPRGRVRRRVRQQRHAV